MQETELNDKRKALFDECDIPEALETAVYFYEECLREMGNDSSRIAEAIRLNNGVAVPGTDSNAWIRRFQFGNPKDDPKIMWSDEKESVWQAFVDLTLGNPWIHKMETEYTDEKNDLAKRIEELEADNMSLAEKAERADTLEGANAELTQEVSDLIDQRNELNDQIRSIKVAASNLSIQ